MDRREYKAPIRYVYLYMIFDMTQKILMKIAIIVNGIGKLFLYVNAYSYFPLI